MYPRVEIDTDRIRLNIRALLKRIGTSALIAVVKENAYGCGLIPVSSIAVEEGACALAVTTITDAVTLRKSGLSVPIMLLAKPQYEELATAVDFNLTIPINSADDIDIISSVAAAADRIASIALAVNTGMNRYGIAPEDARHIAETLKLATNLSFDFIYSHLDSSEFAVDTHTDEQLATFRSVLAVFELYRDDAASQIAPTVDCDTMPSDERSNTPVISLANSAAVLRYPETHFDAVRSGCLPLGITTIEGEENPADFGSPFSFRTVVSHVRPVKAGDTVGYNRTYTVPSDSHLAVISGGYGSGIPSRLSNNGEVLIGGRRYPIVGNICMSQFTVNLGPDTTVRPGDVVTLVGTDGRETISVDDIEARTGLKLIEIMCNFSALNPIIHL